MSLRGAQRQGCGPHPPAPLPEGEGRRLPSPPCHGEERNDVASSLILSLSKDANDIAGNRMTLPRAPIPLTHAAATHKLPPSTTLVSRNSEFLDYPMRRYAI